jgi:crossover junction endodeoxyribonuclease RuvC
MRILGLDPGSRRLGYGVLERAGSRWRRVDSGTLRLNPDHALARRLDGAYQGVVELLRIHAPDLVVIEECFVARGPKAALVLGEVRGVLLLATHQAGRECLEVAPRAVKLAVVGHGGAAKEQIQYMIPRLVEECPSALAPDEADALAIAWCGAARQAVAELARGRGRSAPA